MRDVETRSGLHVTVAVSQHNLTGAVTLTVCEGNGTLSVTGCGFDHSEKFPWRPC